MTGHNPSEGDIVQQVANAMQRARDEIGANEQQRVAFAYAEAAMRSELGPRLRELLRISPAMEGWQPIETAPKDGTWILLRGRNSANYPMIPVVCRWSRPVHGRGEPAWRDSGSDRDMSSLVSDVPPGATADWAPLPEGAA